MCIRDRCWLPFQEVCRGWRKCEVAQLWSFETNSSVWIVLYSYSVVFNCNIIILEKDNDSFPREGVLHEQAMLIANLRVEMSWFNYAEIFYHHDCPYFETSVWGQNWSLNFYLDFKKGIHILSTVENDCTMIENNMEDWLGPIILHGGIIFYENLLLVSR